MDQAAFRPHDRKHLQPRIAASNADSCTTTAAVSCKRKASAGHQDAPPASRHQKFNQHEDALARPAAGQVVERKNTKDEQPPRGPVRAEAEDSLRHGDRSASKNGGSTMERPIIIIDDDSTDGLPCPEQETTALNNGGSPCTEREPATPWHGGDNTPVSPFGYRTWDPTDGGRYELLSTYLPPPCLDGDLEDALWGLAAAYTSPNLYTSPADAFWGTPDGVWTLY